jgi:hypothetical protein
MQLWGRTFDRHGQISGVSHLCDCVLDNLLVRHIALVSYEQLVDTLSGVPVDLLQPLLDVVEAVHIRDIVDDADAVGTPVVGRGDCAETFLAGGIPLHSVFWLAGCAGLPIGFGRISEGLTIWSFTVLPSSSIVRIFCFYVSHVSSSRREAWLSRGRTKSTPMVEM